jgi:predicted Fe-Mo cluster-binding NifX family protein
MRPALRLQDGTGRATESRYQVTRYAPKERLVMHLCVPVLDNQGLDSLVCGHFGSAPAFMIVDSESGDCRLVANNNAHHAHGMCQPLAVLGGESIDGIIVGGIGMGALMKLQAAGITVYRAQHPTVGETVTAFKAGTLQPIGAEEACAGHGHHQD